MQGPTIKTYFASQKKLDVSKIVNVALTPCTAKKFEIRREEMSDASKELTIDGLRDMDYVITTRELAKWLKEEGISFEKLEESDYDNLLGAASGAGVIFGNTGGVMEAASRTAYYFVTGENPPEDYLEFNAVRGMDGLKEANVTMGGIPLRLAVVHGEANAKKVLDQMDAGIVKYDFIEVMNCRGGCIGGGGQPKTDIFNPDNARKARIESLYKKDKGMSLRFSHENPDIQKVYQDFYEKPGSQKAEKMLHTIYTDRSANLGIKGKIG